MSQQEQSRPPETPRFAWRAGHTGLAAGVVTLAALVAAGNAGQNAPVTAALTLATGVIAATSQATGRSALLVCVLAGLGLGVLSSLDFIRHDVPTGFDIVAATLAVFLLLGLIAGAFAELVRFLHAAVHGRRGN